MADLSSTRSEAAVPVPFAERGAEPPVRTSAEQPATGKSGRRRSRATRPVGTPEQAHALRAVINRYELSSGAAFPRSVVVTPAGKKDDAVGVSRSLATIFAGELGQATCWVDFGWLDATGRPGTLSDSPGGASAPVMTATDDPYLTEARFTPVDPMRANAAVRSTEVVEAIAAIIDRFERVVFTLPPVLTTPAALAIVPHAEGSLVVATYRSTRLVDVERAIATLAPTPNLAVVVNRFDPSIPRVLRRICGG